MTDEASPKGRLRRWWPGAVAILLLGAAAFWLYRPVSAALTLLALLRDDGLAFRLVTVDTGQLVLRDLRFGHPLALEADEVRIDYSIAGLFAGRIDRLGLQDPALIGRLEGGRLSFGALDAYLGEGGGSAGSPLAIDRLQIDDATLQLDTPAGTLRIAASISGRLGPGGLAASGDIGLLHDNADGHGVLDLIQDDGGLRVHAGLRQGEFVLPELAGTVIRTEADLARSADGKLNAALELVSGTIRFADTALGQLLLSARLEPDALRGEVTMLSGDTKAGGMLSFTVSGLADAEPTMALTGHVAAAGLAPFRALLPPGTLPDGLDLAGRLDIDLHGLLDLAALRAGAINFPDAPPVIAGTIDVTLDSLDMPGVVKGLSGRLPLRIDTEAAAINLSMTDKATLNLPGLAGLQAADGTGLLGLVPDLAGPLQAEFQGTGAGRPWLRGSLGSAGASAVWDASAAAASGQRQLLRLVSAGEARIGAAGWQLKLPLLEADAASLRIAGLALRDLKLTANGDGDHGDLAGKLALSASGKDISAEGIQVKAPRLDFATPFRLHAGRLDAGMGGCLRAGTDGIGTATLKATLSPLALCGGADGWLSYPLSAGGAATARAGLQVVQASLADADGTALGTLSTGAIALEAKYEPAAGSWQAVLVSQEPSQASLSSLEIELSRAELRALLRHRPGKPIDAQLRLDGVRIVHAVPAPLFSPLTLTLQGLSDGRLVEGDGSLQLAAGAIALPLRLHHDLAEGSGSLAIGTAEDAAIAFDPASLQPQDIVPFLKGKVTEVAGRLDLLAGALWAPGRSSTGGRIVLKDGAAQTELAALQGIDLDLTMDSLWPPISKAHQQLTIARIDLGLPLEDGRIDFTVAGDRVDLHRAAWPFAGGELFLENASLALAGGVQGAVLQARDLDLAQLLALLRTDDLSATGRVGGILPLRLDGDRLLVSGGRLQTADGGGTIRYLAEPPGGEAESGEQVALLFKALKNFQYRNLALDVDGDLAGALSVQAHILGANPEVYDGHPFELNLDLSGDLAALVRQGLATTTIPEKIRRSLEQQESPK